VRDDARRTRPGEERPDCPPKEERHGHEGTGAMERLEVLEAVAGVVRWNIHRDRRCRDSADGERGQPSQEGVSAASHWEGLAVRHGGTVISFSLADVGVDNAMRGKPPTVTAPRPAPFVTAGCPSRVTSTGPSLRTPTS